MSDSAFSLNLAVVIGINDYQNGIPTLGTAKQDAEAIAAILENDYKYQVHLLTDSQATGQALKNWLETELPKSLEKDHPSRLVFYFAGHGIALNGDDGPQGYLIPQDAKLGDAATYLPMQQVEAALTKLSCRHCLIILDCCFAGAFRWSSTRKAVYVPEKIYKERYDRFIKDPAWQVITSAASDQFALDNLDLNSDRRIAKENSNHSPFAAALMEALQGEADAYPPAKNGKPAGDGVITATELYLYLRDAVEVPTDAINQRQTPQIWPLKKHDKGEFVFLPPGYTLNLPPAPPLDESKNPYRGLQSFEEKHSPLFFGRTELIKELERFFKQNNLTIVLGTSGSGKSSLVKAGLIPELRKDKDEDWCILPAIRPNKIPFKALNQVLQAKKLPSVEIDNPEKSLAKSISIWAKEYPQSKLLIFIDQSEELITLCDNEDERKEFFQQILDAINKHPKQLRVILTLRSDFEPQVRDKGLELVTHSEKRKKILERNWYQGRFNVPAMTRGELREAIEKPAEAMVMYFDPHELTEQLIDEVADMPGALPLLSFALSELYLKYLKRQREAEFEGETIDRAITEQDYQELGSVVDSITKRADEEYEAFENKNSAYTQIIRDVMLRMVAVGGGELARRRVPLSELEYLSEKKDLVDKVIKQFTEVRLLVQGKDAAEKSYVEPAHDALVRGWPRLLRWTQENKESLLLQRLLTPAAMEWENQQKPNDFLWNTNPRLDLLKRALYSDENWLNTVESDFVKRSIGRRTFNTRRNGSILIGVIVALISLTAYALNQTKIAQNQLVSTIGSLTNNSQELFESNKRFDALIASLNAGKNFQQLAFGANPDLQMRIKDALQNSIIWIKERNRFEGHNGGVSSISFSPNGQMLASDSSDGTIKVWDTATGKVINTLDKTKIGINSASFIKDGLLAFYSGDGSIKFLDVTTGKVFNTLNKKEIGVKGVTFGSNGRIASRTTNNTIKLWDVTTGKVINTLKTDEMEGNHSENIIFSPDGQRLASRIEQSDKRGIKPIFTIWNVSTGELINTVKVKAEGYTDSVSFSPDGKLLASAGEDTTIHLWDVATGQEIKTFIGHTRRISSVSFSPNGQILASASWDATIKFWNVATGKNIKTLTGHKAQLNSLSFSPNDNLLASSSSDGAIKIWDTSPPQEVIPVDNYLVGEAISISPDRKLLASIQRADYRNQKNEIKLWDVANHKKIATLTGHGHWIKSVSFSPDGQWLASAAWDYSIKFWNIRVCIETTTCEASETLKLPSSPYVESISFSPNGKLLASAGNRDWHRNNDIQIWDIATRPLNHEPIKILKGEKLFIVSVRFSPDGKLLASANHGKNIKIWNIDTGEEIKTLKGHKDGVNEVSFSTDGKLLASASNDNTIKLWNIMTGIEIKTFTEHKGSVSRVIFSQDGKWLVSSSYDNTIKIWDVATGKVTNTLRGHDGIINLSLSNDGQLLASQSGEKVLLWNMKILSDFTFNNLITRGCNWMRGYLQNNPNVSESDRHLCDDVKK